jgi:hypothetical protein
METTEPNTEPTATKIPYSGKLDPAVYAVIDRLRRDEDRPLSNMMERLLKTHPRVQEILEATPEVVAQ